APSTATRGAARELAAVVQRHVAHVCGDRSRVARCARRHRNLAAIRDGQRWRRYENLPCATGATCRAEKPAVRACDADAGRVERDRTARAAGRGAARDLAAIGNRQHWGREHYLTSGARSACGTKETTA